MQNKQTNKRDNKKQETAKQRKMAFTFLLFKLEACHRLDSTNKYNDVNDGCWKKKVKDLLKRLPKFQVGIEVTTFVTRAVCYNQRGTR